MIGRLPLSIGALAVTLPALFALTPGGRRAVPSALAAPGPSASSSAALPETLPVLTGKDIPETASGAPTDAEWAHARIVSPHRGASGPCVYRNVREWLEIRCTDLAGAGLVAGDPKGVVVRAVIGKWETDPPEPSRVRVVVPIRRGEVKMLGFLELRFEYNGTSVAEAGTLSIVWRAGRPDPVLVSSGFISDERPPER
jgi:hypothetical protein